MAGLTGRARRARRISTHPSTVAKLQLSSAPRRTKSLRTLGKVGLLEEHTSCEDVNPKPNNHIQTHHSVNPYPIGGVGFRTNRSTHPTYCPRHTRNTRSARARARLRSEKKTGWALNYHPLPNLSPSAIYQPHSRVPQQSPCNHFPGCYTFHKTVQESSPWLSQSIGKNRCQIMANAPLLR